MPTVESFRGYTATIVAALCVLGGGAAALYLSQLPPTEPPRELTIIFGIIGGLIGTGTTFLFLQDSSSRASHATERAMDQGVNAGAALPAQAPGTTTTITTPSEPPTPGGDTIGGAGPDEPAEPLPF